MKIFFFSFTQILWISTLFVFMPKPVSAQTLSLSLSPPVLELLIQPGRKATQEYHLKNLGEETSLIAVLMEYAPYGLQPLDPNDPSEQWIRWEEKSISWNTAFTMHKGEEKSIQLTIAPPQYQTEKDYYRAIVFRTIPSPGSEFSQSLLQQEISSVVLMTISASGMSTKSLQISPLTTPRLIDSFDSLAISIAVKNTGSSFTRVLADVTLTSGLGKAVYHTRPQIILAGQTARLETLTNAGSESEENNQIRGFFIGKYTIKAAAHRTNSPIETATDTIIYAVPWKALFGICIVAFLLKILSRLKNLF